jgi:single-strand DNA-binding protein
MSFNKITIVGYLGQDPQLRYTPKGIAVCNFSVATTERRKNEQGETEEHTLWFRVSAWARLAEIASEYLAKGRQVYLEGRLRKSEYTDREGQKQFSLEVSATEIQFLGQGGNGARESAGRSDESDLGNNQAEAEGVTQTAPRSASGKSGKKGGSKRGSKSDELVSVEDDEIPF